MEGKITFEKLFLIGIFLLPSAPTISLLFLLISGFYSSIKFKKEYFKDKWNLPFFISGIFLILSCFFNSINRNYFYSFDYDPILSWIGLFNWIPYFWSFWSFQFFLRTPKQRKKISIALLLGSIPVLITGILQYFFKVNGPFILWNGFLTWYLRPIEGYNGLTGLFSNANYTGAWLNIILPFSFAIYNPKEKSFVNKFCVLIYIFILIICTILTFSRNSWLGLILGLLLIFEFKNIKYIISFIGGVLASIYFFGPKISGDFPSIWSYKFNFLFNIENFFSSIRFDIWYFAVENILKKPIWGWGAGAFPEMFRTLENSWKGHAHNLPLDLAFNYGLPVCLIIISTILIIIMKSYKNIRELKNDITFLKFEKAWLFSCLLIILNQMFDITYNDLRIGIVFWILLGGLRNVLYRNI